MATLDIFPRELILEILKFSSVHDVLNFGLISKRYHRLSQDSLLWAYLAQIKLGFPPDDFLSTLKKIHSLIPEENSNWMDHLPWQLYKKIRKEFIPKNCQFIPSRGFGKGKMCGIRVKEGTPYCSWHISHNRYVTMRAFKYLFESGSN